MKIIVDAMGGDYAPASVLEGAAEALREKALEGVDMTLVGNLQIMEPFLLKFKLRESKRIHLHHAEQFIRMDDSSTTALRGKKESSITIAAKLVGDGHGDALVSIGHTGAAVAATKIKMKMLPGVERPAIATIVPSAEGRFVLLDAGANVDCKAQNLAQFAVLGEVYTRAALGIKNPRIGLLNVGDEDIKGNELTKAAFKILSKMPINFIGNVESRDMFENKADVAICDGFVGNNMLKTCEGLSKAVMHWLKKAFTKNAFRQAGAILAREAFVELKAMGNYEEYGGAPLLGVNGICIIGHGASTPKAVRNAIKVGAHLVKQKVNSEIVRRIDEAGIAYTKS